MPIPWSPKEKQLLVEMVNAGKTLEDCCRVFIGRTNHGIYCKVHDMEMKFKNEGELDMEAFKQIMRGNK
jgi:hypothetical protein